MNCASYDWKAYALGELGQEDRRHAEAHAAVCAICREELATLRLTIETLSKLPDEEMPRRIAFVSDKVFEPRWWQVFLRPSFAAACVIAAAILAHAFVRPAAAIDSAALQTQVDSAVTKAVAQVEKRHYEETQQLLAAYDLLSKQFARMYAINTGMVRQ